MTKTEKRRWRGAIGKLERFYRAVAKGKKSDSFLCPLCDLSRELRSPEKDCSFNCLWWKYEGMMCPDNAVMLWHEYNIPWAKSSLKRLARWRARLEKEKNDL